MANGSEGQGPSFLAPAKMHKRQEEGRSIYRWERADPVRPQLSREFVCPYPLLAWSSFLFIPELWNKDRTRVHPLAGAIHQRQLHDCRDENSFEEGRKEMDIY